MESKRKLQNVRILMQEEIAKGIHSLWLESEEIAKTAKPGQFINVYCNESSRMLPRPLSICETDPDRAAIRLVYRAAGDGTREFASLKEGEFLDVLGPLGNGFPLDIVKENRTALLVGGGIGIPPLVALSKSLFGHVLIVAGYKDELFLTEELLSSGQLYIATEDGSRGTFGTVMDCIRRYHLIADVIYSCGPTPMLRAVKEYAKEREILCYLSLEEKMACGIGACLSCVCASTKTDEHTKVKNKRVCREGPVFEADEICL